MEASSAVGVWCATFPSRSIPEDLMSASIPSRAPWMLLACMLAASAAQAAPQVTIYTRDLAFVRETRTLEIAGARDTLRIPDVPERLDFSSVAVDLTGAARVTRLAYR